MNRHTARYDNGQAYFKAPNYDCTEEANALAAYEDSGLEPEEIETLKREYLKTCPKPDGCPFQRTFSHGQGCCCGLESKEER